MGTHNAPEPDPELIAALREHMEAQPWYRRFANTVSTAVGAITMVIWFLVSTGVDIPDQLTASVGAAIAIFTTLGVLKTPNGITPRGINQVKSVMKE